MQTEFMEALQDLQRARQNFENASPEFIETAIYNLAAAEKKLDTLVKELKIGKGKKSSLEEESLLKVLLQ